MSEQEHNPFEVLGVGREASSEEIRRSYLHMVRKQGPEKDPVAFQEIRKAYEQLKDEKGRIEARLFSFGELDGGGSVFEVTKEQILRCLLAADQDCDVKFAVEESVRE
ncbi:MAG: DnaJ domain-containing protein [Firmicutes bacterium]|nr:DnaJ domain-containing protein [Bacillota bacterium]